MSSRKIPPASPWMRLLFALDAEIVFLNHGSFGACPRAVLAAQSRLRERMERDPMRFFLSDLEGLMDEARAALADFLHAEAEDLVFVQNATAGVNTVLGALRFLPGEEILTTSHEYNAVRNALAATAEAYGAKLVVAPIPFPLSSSKEVLDCVLDRITERTRLVALDHVTSQTGLIFPVEKLAAELSVRGVDLLVDGAHAPGMLPLDLSTLSAMGVAFYTGNCHKWLCAPKGAAFLWVRRDRQAEVRPLCKSHGYNSPRKDRSRFRLEFDWTGTFDPTAWLCVPAALSTMGSILPGGWAELMRENRELVLKGRALLCRALGIDAPCPEDMIGALASVPLPGASAAASASPLHADPLQQALSERYRIQVPVIPWPCGDEGQPPGRLLRISAQIYNTLEQYEYLAGALAELLGPKNAKQLV